MTTKTATFLYKCRLCGEIEKNPHTGEKHALLYLTAAISGNKVPGLIGPPLTMLNVHSCKNGMEGNIGVADLIGYEIKE